MVHAVCPVGGKVARGLLLRWGVKWVDAVCVFDGPQK